MRTAEGPATPFSGLGARHRAVAPHRAAPTEHPSKTAHLRYELAQRGRLSAKNLAELVGLASPSLVGALLKHDLQKGRVLSRDGFYEVNQDFDEDEAAEEAHAIELLRRRGYTVTKPAGH